MGTLVLHENGLYSLEAHTKHVCFRVTAPLWVLDSPARYVLSKFFTYDPEAVHDC